jgi:hypothetical protein
VPHSDDLALRIEVSVVGHHAPVRLLHHSTCQVAQGERIPVESIRVLEQPVERGLYEQDSVSTPLHHDDLSLSADSPPAPAQGSTHLSAQGSPRSRASRCAAPVRALFPSRRLPTSVREEPSVITA